jgi:hypothetical protein
MERVASTAWYLDEVFVMIKGRRHYLWRAVDQDGDTLDILVQSRRNQRAAERFFRKLLKGEGASPRQLVTLTSSPVIRRHGAPRCLQCRRSRRDVPTTGPRLHISRPVRASARCGVLSRSVKRSAFWPRTRWPAIHFA